MAERRYLSDRTRSALKPFAAFLGILIFLAIFRRLSYTSAVSERFEASLANVGANVGQGLTRLVASENSLAVRLTVCEEDKALLAREAVEYARLREENEELRALLDYRENSQAAGVTARIIARSLPEEEPRVVIDKGMDDGVQVGGAVVVGQGIVFGIVTAAGANASTVTLITSSNSTLPAAILGKRKTVGLLEGRDGAILTMEFVPREAGVVRGDVVVTSGLGGEIAEGLLLGTITEVIDMESAPFAEALVEPLEDPLSWSAVLVLPRTTNAL